jgi:hypothetical protein
MNKAKYRNVVFGPFKASWHQKHVSNKLKNDLVRFIDQVIEPQVTIRYSKCGGTLVASCNDDKYCGPHSAVRDIYRLTYAYETEDEIEDIDIELIYHRDTGEFTKRWRGLSLKLVTVEHRRNIQKLYELIRMAWKDRTVSSITCPFCDNKVDVSYTSELFAVHCDNNCFESHYHLDAQSGEMKHGHVFVR